MASAADTMDEGLESAYRAALAPGGQESASAEGLVESLGDIKDKFKQLWPSVKQGLELLKMLSKVLPIGGMVVVVIDLVIKAGDAAFKAIG